MASPTATAARSRRAANIGLLLAFLVPLGLLLLGWALRDVVPPQRQRPARFSEGYWAPAGALNAPRADVGTAAAGGRIYVFGGLTGARGDALDTSEIYDPATDRWSDGPRLGVARGASRAAAIGETIYLVGGLGGDRSELDLHEAFETASGRWRRLAPLPAPRFGHATVALDGRVYAIGGFAGGRGVATVEIYDPAIDRWTAAAPLPTPRHSLAAVVYEGKIYTLGGVADGAASKVVEIYDPATASWSAGPALPIAVANFGAAVLDGRIHALHHDTHQIFEPASRRWVGTDPMPTRRHGQGVATLGDTLYAFGGSAGETQSDLAVTEAFRPGVDPNLADPSPQVRAERLVGSRLAVVGGALLTLLLIGGGLVAGHRPRGAVSGE